MQNIYKKNFKTKSIVLFNFFAYLFIVVAHKYATCFVISEHQRGGVEGRSHALVWFRYLIGLPAAMLHNDVRRQQLMEQMGWSSTRVHSIRAVIMEPAAVFITDISHPWLIPSASQRLIQTACIKAAQLSFLSICVDVRSPASVGQALVVPDQLNLTTRI